MSEEFSSSSSLLTAGLFSGRSICSLATSSGMRMRPLTATEPLSHSSKSPVPSKILIRNLTVPSLGMMVARRKLTSSIITGTSSNDLPWSLAKVFHTRTRYPVAGNRTLPSIACPPR
uniref:Uncharacterized protein n=1 Tax=Cacopsylla melanoneura TaxID=428564 RepID=A0A8D8LPS2_9HEMI